MKVLLLVILSLVSLSANAVTYYVDQEAGSNGTGTNISPWNSVANIDTLVIAPADTVCIKGAFTGAGWTVTEAGTSGNILTYDFNCSGWGQGSITATSGTAAVLDNKGFTTVKNGQFTYASGPAIQINASDVRIESNTIDGGDQGIILTTNSERDRVVITGNTVKNVQGNGASDASAAGIYLLQTSTTRWEWDDLQITNNILTNNLQGGINLKCDFGASTCIFNRLTISGNIVSQNDNTGIVLQDCYELGATSCADADTNADADFNDVVIEDNIVTNQTAGGGMAIYGLDSSTSAFGKNFIRDNISSGNVGVIGGIDLFNSLYVIVEGNTTSNNTTATIDGNGILIDYGNRYTIVRKNIASNNVGVAATDNSGLGIMALKCQDLDIYSNVGDGNKAGLFFSGNAFAESNCRVWNNTFTDNADYGVYVDASQEASSVSLLNNALDGPGTCVFAESGGAAQTENYNALACVTRRNYNGVGWSDGASSIVTSLDVNSDFKPRPSSPLIGAGSPNGAKYDYANKRCGNPSTIGAYCSSFRETFPTRSTYVTR